MAPKDGRVPSDAELVDSYQRNHDLKALDTLVERYVDTVPRPIFATVLNDNDADDLTQETFVNVVRGLHKFEQRSKFSTWLHQVALNTVRRHFRTRRRWEENIETHTDRQAGPAVDEPERKATASELHADIAAALGALSPHLRTAVVFTVIEGLSAREVADIEGCAPETIRWRVHEARKILKERLAEYLNS